MKLLVTENSPHPEFSSDIPKVVHVVLTPFSAKPKAYLPCIESSKPIVMVGLKASKNIYTTTKKHFPALIDHPPPPVNVHSKYSKPGEIRTGKLVSLNPTKGL